jgi:hypothetical protein
MSAYEKIQKNEKDCPGQHTIVETAMEEDDFNMCIA